MTTEEASKAYGIPICALKEYERWGLCGGPYDQRDIERLSLIMTLHDVGFAKEEIEQYMRLYLSPRDTARARAEMLQAKRSEALDEIHRKQKQLDRLDYLRFELTKGSKNAQNDLNNL